MRKNIIFILALLMLTSTMAFAAKKDKLELPKDILVIEQTGEYHYLTITAIDLSNNEFIIITYKRDSNMSGYGAFELFEITRTGMKADPGHYFNRQ